MEKVTEIFGSMVFNDSVMEALLPKQTYKALQSTIKQGKRLDAELASVVANAMKSFETWAIVGVMYLVVITILSHIAKFIERRMNRGR